MSDAKRLPWTKWYWSAWRADAQVRDCCLAARGLWADMLSIMDQGQPYGHLTSKGKPPSTGKLAELVGASQKEVAAMLQELEDAGVFSRTSEGIIYSRRMVRDRAKSERGKAWGKEGGNPALTGKDNPDLKATDKPRDNGRDKAKVKSEDMSRDKQTHARDLEARGKKEETTDSEPSESPPPAKAVVARFLELRAEHWPSHPSFAAPTMTLEQQAGEYLRQGGTVDLIGATLAKAMATKVAKNEGPPTDFGCVSRSLPDAIAKARAAAPDSEPMHFDQARERIAAECRLWQRDGKWRGKGPAPDHPDTDVPAAVRAELGIVTRQEDAA